MPITTSAKKKLRSDARKKQVNKKMTIQLKSKLKKFRLEPSKSALEEAYSALDSAAKKNAIPKRRASRKKSRLAEFLNKKSSRTSISKKNQKTGGKQSSQEN